MRFQTYKLIVDTAASVYEAAEYVKHSGDRTVLAICKNALAAIKRKIQDNPDSLASDRIHGIIAKLSESLEEAAHQNIDSVIELADGLHTACVTDIDYKIRALIVAELGGKWDSLASVYDSLTNRSDCEVEVVIEPVYRAVKLPDGSTRNDVVYEDFLTPIGIENIPFQQYDIAVSKPDITFFSQPYDSCTIPMFRTANLAKHSKLVYCPYFSADTLDKNISSAQDAFFQLPAQQLSWRIACQSERMKKYYGIYASRKGENVIPCGIPKWDYPTRLNRDNVPCPAAWAEKMKGRTVILWNSHFVSIHMSANDHSDAFSFEKKMLAIFKENKNAVLLWRPHPMSESVLKVISPDKYSLYKKMLEEAERSDNIIIDRNATYDCAFVWSDALISDYSSLIAQYIIMDKPYALLSQTNDEATSEKFYTVDGLQDFSKMKKLCNFDHIKHFVGEICNGIDSNIENRKYIRDHFFELADGNAGKRFVDALFHDFYAEELPAGPSPKEKGAVLVIGSARDAKPCISSLNEQGVRWFLCKDYIEYVDTGSEENLISIKDVKDELFDCVVIADRSYEPIITQLLTTVYRIAPEKMISFWKMYNASLPAMVCDRVMMNPKVQEYEGIILGISHSEVGIIAEQLKAPFCNLSVSSQDIYYQLKTLEYCIANYPEKLKNLKYAIVDLYDYKYFNYDTSLSASAVNYIFYGGYHGDAHNFSDNKNYQGKYADYVNLFESRRMNGITNRQIEIWNELFSDVHKCTDYEGFCGNFNISERLREVNAEDLDGYNYSGGSAQKIFPKTIEENKRHIRALFDTLRSINRDMKIYTIIIPKYIEAEVRQAEYIAKFVKGFNSILEELHHAYDFTMLDFNKISDISMHKAFYYDAAHLNYFGAKRLTEQLNEIIFQ